MASHEVDDAELGSASAHGIPGSEAGPDGVNNSVYRPIDGSQDYQKGELQFLGAIQILNAAMILALGVFLGSLQYLFYFNRHFFFFTFYTGYPIWGAVFFCISGTLSVVAGRKPTRTRMQHSFGMNIASAMIALVGIAFLSVNLAVNVQSLKSCQSSPSLDLCIYMGSISNGMVSLLLILTFLELCVSISTLAMWCNANCCDSREAISSSPSSVESRIPPYENNSESMNI
ncbi:membrane-spanning 4-domains subfamily A member 3 isoform X1 [Aotus nancymaae]|uniref:Membrane spanning 4-domains A3 n=1 Tax=Aotus nancymaae TaxID=37293 RepID=A0A2K5DWH2_AOTNA|nr:membrane-spanning 4-domains subfamily A member 3 isoform X1 [Aotus nancymaae]